MFQHKRVKKGNRGESAIEINRLGNQEIFGIVMGLGVGVERTMNSTTCSGET